MMPGMVPLELESVLVSSEPGLWCPNCLLSSALACNGVVSLHGTFMILGRFRLVECQICGADLSDDHPGGEDVGPVA